MPSSCSSSSSGDALYGAKRFEEALAAYSLESKEGDKASLLANCAACRLMMGGECGDAEAARSEYARAIEDCEASLRVRPSAKALLRRAAARVALGDVGSARRDCEAAGDERREEAARVGAACDALEAALAELRSACWGVVIDADRVGVAASRARRVAPHARLGELTEAVEAMRRRDIATAKRRLDEAITRGGAAPPGGAAPHRAALYAVRSRVSVLGGKIAAARDDLSRAATAAGARTTAFAAVGGTAEASLVRLKARCDLLAARRALERGPRDKRRVLLEIAAATATLEAAEGVGETERAEIQAELKLAEDAAAELEASLDDEPGVAFPPDASFAVYDAKFRAFEGLVAAAPGASVGLADLPLPPADASVSGANGLMPADEIKARIRAALLRWHPDKAAAVAPKFRPEDRDALLNTAAAVTRRIIVEKRELRLTN